MKKPEVKEVTTLREYIANAKEAVGVIRWIWREITTQESKQKIYRLLASLSVVILLQAIAPATVSYIFSGLASKNADLVRFGLVTFAASLFIQKLVDRYQQSMREWILGLHMVRFDERITELFFEKSVGQHIHEGTALSVSNIDKGRWKVIELQGMLIFEGIPTIIQLSLYFIFLAVLSPVSGIIMTVVLAVYLAWSMYLNFTVSHACAPIDKETRALNRRRVERWERVERVKVCGKEREETVELSRAYNEIMERGRAFWLNFVAQTHARSMVNATGLVMIMTYGAWLVWSGKWNIGLLYPLYAWSTKVCENVWKLGDIEHQLNWNMPMVKSMIEALGIAPNIVDKKDAVNLQTTEPVRIEFINVSHTYPAETTDLEEIAAALKKVNFTIEPGEKVALLGPSGAGKSTVMKKLLRFEDPTSGVLRVDGIDLRDITQASWKQGIGYIPQQSQVFDGTIRYNLTYGLNPAERAKVTDDDLRKLMDLLQIDFKERLTAGLDTVVGKNGIKLSGGQAQRLMIGAAVMKKPWLLVVDEATSSLDSTTERKVQEGLAKVLQGSRTSALIVAHRLSTVRHLCTKFVMLKASNEVVNGDSQVEAVANSFEELYRISPTFRSLATDQGIVISQEMEKAA